MQAVEAVASGRADALVSGGSTGSALAASLFRFKRAPGVHRPALAIVVPVPGAPFLLLDAGANVAVRPEHLVQFAHMGAAFMEVVMGVRRPRVALLSNGEEPSKGPEDVVAAHAALSASPAGEMEFVGNVEGFAIGKGVADVLVADGFTGNVALKVMEGHLGRAAARRAGGRDLLAALQARRPAAAPALRGLRDEIDPEAHGGAVLLGLRKLGVVPHGSFGERGFASAIEVAARGVREDVLGRTHERLAAAGALRKRARAVRGRRYGAGPVMTRDEVLELIRAHLADELQIDPARIAEETHFKQDLDADSLDLYTLVLEFEDTYGVKMSDEQAARVQTVGQAVDFVLAHLPSPSSS